jgi:hypothetical protein
MFAELIDFFSLLGTLPNHGIFLAEAMLVLIVTALFALELAAAVIVIVGVILKASTLSVLKASALPHVRLSAHRPLPRLPRAWLARGRIDAATPVSPAADAATPVSPAADKGNHVLAKLSDRSGSLSASRSIEGLARAIRAAQSG